MKLTEQRTQLLAAARQVVESAKNAGRELTATETASLVKHVADVRNLDERIGLQKTAEDAMTALGGGSGGGYRFNANGSPAEYRSGSFGGIAGGEYLSLTNAGTAAKIAGQMRGNAPAGSKALAPSGTVLTDITLNSDSPIALGRVAQSILDILPVTKQTSTRYGFLQQQGRNLQAAPVVLGDLKPTSTLGLALVQRDLAVIAHLSEPVPEYWLQDLPSLSRFVADELLYGLRSAVENQILNGTGVGANLTGILQTSGILTQAAVGTDLFATTRQAVTALESLGGTPGAWIFNALDWQRFDLARNVSGNFDLREGPVDTAKRLLWSIPVVVSNTIAAGTAALIDPSAISVDIDGFGVQTRWSEAAGDDFVKNMVRARCEGRFGVSVFKPMSVVKVTLPAA